MDAAGGVRESAAAGGGGRSGAGGAAGKDKAEPAKQNNGGAGSGANAGAGAAAPPPAADEDAGIVQPDGDVSEACRACRERNCRDYQGAGIDLVHGCFEKIDPFAGADVADPNFLEDCTEVMRCALRTRCAYVGQMSPSICYCGTVDVDSCINGNMVPSGACKAEIERAARTAATSDLAIRFSDLKYPIGWANFLLECDVAFCSAECTL